jgi:hypothetical protein
MQLLADISGNGMINAVIWLIIVGLIFGLLWWLIGYCAIPEPFNKVARVVLAIFAVLILINALLTVVGHGFIRW